MRFADVMIVLNWCATAYATYGVSSEDRYERVFGKGVRRNDRLRRWMGGPEWDPVRLMRVSRIGAFVGTGGLLLMAVATTSAFA